MQIQTKKEIGSRLREKREQAGYTREKLGELCSLSPRFIANVEFGESTFSLDSLMSVSRVLCCTTDYLLFGTEDKSQWEIICTKLRRLPPRFAASAELLIRGYTEAIELAME